MEQFIFEDADGEYTDDFETNDRAEALAYGQEHHLKVVRVYYVEAGTETIADFTTDDDPEIEPDHSLANKLAAQMNEPTYTPGLDD